MKLPGIQYGPVPAATGYEQVGEAGAQLAEGISRGLYALHAEDVKTQSQNAAAHAQLGLAELEQGLTSRKTISTQELRDALGGDLDSVDPELRSQFTQSGLDAATGEVTQMDREDIPVGLVAGLIFDKQSKRILAESAGKITAPGWRAPFEEAAKQDIDMRRLKLRDFQVKSMLESLRAQQVDTADKLTRAGNFDAAAAVIDHSNALDPAEKLKFQGVVEHSRQIYPLEQRVLKGLSTPEDLVDAGKLIGRLESGEGFDAMDPQERIQWKSRLEAEVGQLQHASAQAAEANFRVADEAAWNVLLGAYRASGGRSLPMSLVPPPGQVSAGAQKALIAFVESTRPGSKEIQTDLTVYGMLTQAARNPATFKDVDLTGYFGRLSPGDAKHFMDLQRTLKVEGADGASYQSFMGAQEQTDLLLRGHGFAINGKDAEDDALAVGYVESAVNRELEHETTRLRRVLSLDERDVIIAKVVAREVKAKSWEAKVGTSGERDRFGVPKEIDPIFAAPVRDAAIRLGKGLTADAQAQVWTGYQAWENDIAAGWERSAPADRGGPRRMRPEDSMGVFILLSRDELQMRQALKDAGKPNGSRAVGDLAVRRYLRGER